MKKLMVGVVIAAVASGCMSVHKNDGGNSNVKVGVIKDGMHLKYKVGNERVTGKDKLNCLFGFITWGSTGHICDQSEFGVGDRAWVKNGAYANACDAAKCDQIVGARYKVTKKDYFVFSQLEAEVSGFPAEVESVEVLDGIKNPIATECKSAGGFNPLKFLFPFL